MYLFLILLVSVFFIVLATTRFQLHPFLALLLAAIFYGIAAGIAPVEVIKIVNEGFGNTLGQIGVIILFGSIIGKFLEKTGGAFLLAERILKFTGKKMISLTLGLAGYVVSIPVFADSGYIILSSLKDSLAAKSKINVIAPTIALSMGLMASHVMMPPTPGPVAAAGILKADIGLVILLGLPVSLFGFLCAWQFAERFSPKTVSNKNTLNESEAFSEANTYTQNNGILAVILPIAIPIFLIVLKSLAQLPSAPLGNGIMKSTALFIGDPFVALLVGMLLALRLPKQFKINMWSSKGWVGEALLEAAIILLITGAGGAFGKVLQSTALTEVITQQFVFESAGIWLPFIIAAAIKSAQGSSTVAIITTSSLVAPMVASLGLMTPLGLALTVLAIGAGAVVVSHANDSFFWVVTQMSGMNISEGYRFQSGASAVLGISSMVLIFVLSIFLI